MTTGDPYSGFIESEQRAQAEAARAEREGLAAAGDPRVDRYRLIVRSLRQPLAAQLPTDFTAVVAAIARQRDHRDGFEDWMVVLLLLAMGVGALLYAGPTLVQSFQAVAGIDASHLPWRQFASGALGIGVVAAIERGWMRVSSNQRRHR